MTRKRLKRFERTSMMYGGLLKKMGFAKMAIIELREKIGNFDH